MSFLTTIKQPAGDRSTFVALSDPDSAHKHVMSLFPDAKGVLEDARSSLGILFRVDFPKRIADGDVVLRVQSALQIDSTSVPVPSVSVGDTLMVGVRLAAIRRNGSKEFRVPDSEADGWVASLFARSGFDVLDMKVDRSIFRGNRGGLGFHGRDVIARVGVSDERLANDTILDGMGRGKSYGYGLWHVEGLAPRHRVP